MTAEGGCEQADSSLRVRKEDLLIHLFWPEEVSKGRRRRLFARVTSSMHRCRAVTSPLPVCRLTGRGWSEVLRVLSQSGRWDGDVGGRGPALPFRLVEARWTAHISCHAAEFSNVGALPKDVEGDATFGLRLINLMHPSSSAGGRPALWEGGRVEAAHLVVCLCAFVRVYV